MPRSCPAPSAYDYRWITRPAIPGNLEVDMEEHGEVCIKRCNLMTNQLHFLRRYDIDLPIAAMVSDLPLDNMLQGGFKSRQVRKSGFAASFRFLFEVQASDAIEDTKHFPVDLKRRGKKPVHGSSGTPPMKGVPHGF